MKTIIIVVLIIKSKSNQIVFVTSAEYNLTVKCLLKTALLVKGLKEKYLKKYEIKVTNKSRAAAK